MKVPTSASSSHGSRCHRWKSRCLRCHEDSFRLSSSSFLASWLPKRFFPKNDLALRSFRSSIFRAERFCSSTALRIASTALVFLATSVVARPDAPADRIDYQRDVRPLLSDACYRCHGPDEQARQADLRLDLEAGAILTPSLIGKEEIFLPTGRSTPATQTVLGGIAAAVRKRRRKLRTPAEELRHHGDGVDDVESTVVVCVRRLEAGKFPLALKDIADDLYRVDDVEPSVPAGVAADEEGLLKRETLEASDQRPREDLEVRTQVGRLRSRDPRRRRNRDRQPRRNSAGSRSSGAGFR